MKENRSCEETVVSARLKASKAPELGPWPFQLRAKDDRAGMGTIIGVGIARLAV
jgi:hypothetical protein